MKNRWGLAAMAFGLALAAALTPTAATAAPVEPDAAINATTQINKLKSSWGGGWVLNVGQTEGVLVPGHPAQLWFNRDHDWNNRWKVRDGQNDGWWMYENLYSGKCLAAGGFASGLAVVQRNCDNNAPSQRWRLAGDTGFSNGYMPVRNKMIDAATPLANLVLTQQTQSVGALIIMSPWMGAQTQWWKSFRCGELFTNGFPNTPASC